MATVSGTLRAAIKASGESGYALSKRTGVSTATLSRFLRGSVIDATTLDTLAGAVGLVLVAKKAGKARKGR